ncbi:MAG TPA: GspH/FimT family pseudopilin [Gemmatimonadaceae bacterium]|nr:GspH/FimT family pseudopilin [Gemmatimonadaceae bacterium]
MWTQDRRRGFTLLEVIIVLALLAVVAAMGTPRLSAALRRRTTQMAADQFATAHSLARATAVRYGRVAQLHIDAPTKRFWVDVDTSANGIGQRATIWYTRDLTSTGVVMQSNRSLLCFDARGLPLVLGACESGDATVSFTLLDRADTVRTAALGKILR